jgi:hypothetical protein
MNVETISLIVTIILAFTGYLVTYWNSLRIAKRQELLDLVNRRISEFYGPLYVATQTSDKAYRALLQKLGKKAVFDDKNDPPTERDIAEWRVWLETVFMPNNLLIEKLIIEKAYLIQDEQMPDCLLEYITHVSGYKAVMKKWSKGDYSENVSVIGFPEGLREYAAKSYKELKTKQLQLIGNTKIKLRIDKTHSLY